MSDAFLKAIGAVSERADSAATTLAKASYTPPEDVRNNAKRGLELRHKYGRGGLTNSEASKEGIGSGVQRASNLSNGSALSLDTIRRMHAFFERHEKNKDTPPEEGNGKIAWLLWGGDAGRRWAADILREEGILKRLTDLQQRLEKAIKRTGTHIPGDGDGDGIPYEGRTRGTAKPKERYSPTSERSLHQYSGEDQQVNAIGINAALRHGNTLTDEQRSVVGGIDAAFEEATPTTKVMHVFRGTGHAVHGWGEREKAFTSTSTDPDVAKEFATNAAHPERGELATLYEIEIPKGAKAIDMRAFAASGVEYQSEVLLPRGGEIAHNPKRKAYRLHDGTLVNPMIWVPPNAVLKSKLNSLCERISRIEKDGEAPAGDGPTVSDVHVPTADIVVASIPKPKKKPKRAKGEANG